MHINLPSHASPVMLSHSPHRSAGTDNIHQRYVRWHSWQRPQKEKPKLSIPPSIRLISVAQI